MDIPPPEFPDEVNGSKPKVNPAEVMRGISDAMEAYFKGDGEFRLDLQNVKLRIYLDGPKWHGVVDKPVAEFLLDLEKKLRLEFEKLGIKLPKWERGLIALEIDDGSWDALLGYTQEAVDFFKTLAPSYQTVAAGAVMATVGAWANVRRRIQEAVSPVEVQKAKDLATAREQQKALEDVSPELDTTDSGEIEASRLSEEKIEALAKLETIQHDSLELQRPIKTLLGLMTEGDVVTLPAEEEAFKYTAAIQTLEKKAARAPKPKRPTFYVDQHYVVNALNTPSGPTSKWNVKVEYAGVPLTAGLAKLSSEDIAKLTSIYDAAFAKGKSPSVDLQVTAEFDSKGNPKAAIVLGIGVARTNNIGLSAAIAKGKEYHKLLGKK